jgi:hypothetical protein
MATQAQIARLAQRIEALAPTVVESDPWERWIVDGDEAYQLSDPDRVITLDQLAARPGRRIVRVIVEPAPEGRSA